MKPSLKCSNGLPRCSLLDELYINAIARMNRISLDVIGLAGFSHDFRSLTSHESSVLSIFDAFMSVKGSILSTAILILGFANPVFDKIPTARNRQLGQLSSTVRQISEGLLARTKKEKESPGNERSGDKSIIGLLIKAGDSDLALHLSQEEVVAQMNILIFRGVQSRARLSAASFFSLVLRLCAAVPRVAEFQLSGAAYRLIPLHVITSLSLFIAVSLAIFFGTHRIKY